MHHHHWSGLHMATSSEQKRGLDCPPLPPSQHWGCLLAAIKPSAVIPYYLGSFTFWQFRSKQLFAMINISRFASTTWQMLHYCTDVSLGKLFLSIPDYSMEDLETECDKWLLLLPLLLLLYFKGCMSISGLLEHCSLSLLSRNAFRWSCRCLDGCRCCWMTRSFSSFSSS